MTRIAFADLHLSEKPPLCRAGEVDWMKYQRNVVQWISAQAENANKVYIAGDVFDSCTPSVSFVNEVINWFSQYPLKNVEYIFGNHDLPNNNIEFARLSPLWTLARACQWGYAGHKGYDYSRAWVPHNANKSGVVLIHDLVYMHKPFPNAPTKGNYLNVVKQIQGQKLYICGDNHTPFYVHEKDYTFLNCGGVYRRTATQKDYQGRIWRINKDNVCTPIYLDQSTEWFSDEHVLTTKVQKTIDNFKTETTKDISFKDTVNEIMAEQKTCVETRKYVDKAME